MAINRHLLHVKSNQTNTVEVDGNDVVSAKLPRPADIEHGEIAINYHKDYETISIKNDNNEIVQFPNLGAVNTLISEAMSGAQDALTFDETPTANSTNPVTSEGIKSYVDAGDSIQSLTTYQSSTPLAVGDTHDQALSKLSKIIDDNEIITARALTDLNDTKQDEIDDLDEIRTGAALGATALQTETQLSKGTTTGNGNVVTDISVNNHQITLTKGATALTEHQSIKTVNGNTMVGTGNVSVGTITGITMNNVSKGTSGVVDLGTVITSETQLSKGTTTGDGNAVTDITVSNHQITLTKGSTFLVENDLANYADGAEYDSEEHLIYLKHGNTRLSNPINAADFIKDGMVNSVRIDVLDDDSDSSDSSDDEARYLIVTFNTDAGLEDIEIPLSDIFDPSLYYTKEEIDEHELVTAAALTELHDTKADKIDYYTKDEVDELVDGNLDDYYTKQEVDEIVEEDELAISAALNDLNTNKQDVLDFDDEPTENSTNPVTSDGIKTYVDTVAEDIALVTSAALNELNDTIEDIEDAIQSIQPELDFDDTPTAGSDNPVTSSGIKTYVDNASKITTLEEPAVSTPLAVNDTYDTAFGKLTKIIRDNEFTTAGALTELYETKQELLTFDNVPTENSENPVTSGAVYDALSNINTDHLTKVTYSELKTLRDDGELVPGMFYRITDYQCTTTQDNTQSAGHQFDIIVTALSENKLAEEGWAMMHDNIYDVTFMDGVTKKCYFYDLSGDLSNMNLVDISTKLGYSEANDGDLIFNDNGTITSTTINSTSLTEKNLPYNYFQNSNLSAWKVWYCLDNDTERFAWADDSVDEDVEENIKINGGTTPYFRYIDGDMIYENTKLYAWKSLDDIIRYSKIEEVESGIFVYQFLVQGLDAAGKITSYTSYHKGTGSNGRGVIYRLIDEWNNDVLYDFKNIQFKRWAITALTSGSDEMKAALIYDADENPVYFGAKAYDSPVISGATLDDDNYIFAYTFDGALKDAEGNITHYDVSAAPFVGPQEFIDYMIEQEMGEGIADVCYDNFIGNYGEMDIEGDNLAPGLTLPNNVFFNSSYCYFDEDEDYWSYAFANCYGNSLKSYCSNNTFGNGCQFNTFGNGCGGNTFGNYCSTNTFGNSCQNNTFGNGCGNNTFGNYCSINTFGNSCQNNTFGNSCTYNTFGNNCARNTFGNDCGNNTFGNYCTDSTFGNNCGSNTFGNNCYNNTFGNSCTYNTFGNMFQSNTFGNSCLRNTFGNNAEKCSVGDGVQNITVSKDFMRYVIIENGNQKITITSNKTTSSSAYLQNFLIALGVNNSNNTKTISHNSVNDAFLSEYKPANSQIINI